MSVQVSVGCDRTLLGRHLILSAFSIHRYHWKGKLASHIPAHSAVPLRGIYPL